MLVYHCWFVFFRSPEATLKKLGLEVWSKFDPLACCSLEKLCLKEIFPRVKKIPLRCQHYVTPSKRSYISTKMPKTSAIQSFFEIAGKAWKKHRLVLTFLTPRNVDLFQNIFCALQDVLHIFSLQLKSGKRVIGIDEYLVS